ncbi:hypothetical protein ZOSMA_59G00600 [Zostera marina]|uniref:Uncharacterized protein n=1 Tax=Zostera marina TaxID=29655 RepID=A0A0K9NV36_ZOSMR|nr:hypothetical protein ZOSMA_59G00600 [Zostera marina]
MEWCFLRWEMWKGIGKIVANLIYTHISDLTRSRKGLTRSRRSITVLDGRKEAEDRW